MQKLILTLFLFCSILTLSSCGMYSHTEYPDEMEQFKINPEATADNPLEIIQDPADSETVKAILEERKITNACQNLQFLVTLKAPKLDVGQNCTVYKRTLKFGVEKIDCTVLEDHRIALILLVGGMIPGEPMDFLVYQDSSDKYAVGHYVPVPLECSGENGRKLSIEVVDADMSMFKIRCEGLEPFEKIRTISTSAKETMVSNFEASEKGLLLCLVCPGVDGRQFGTANYTIISETGKYSPLTLDYDWGLGSLEKIRKEFLEKRIAKVH